MKVINTEILQGVAFTGGTSYRAILADDNLGFAVMKTVIPKGGPHHWHYKNHLEACYCIEGNGVLLDIEMNKRYDIKPGVVYALDKHDNHTFEAITDVVLISIFNPPLKGTETHKKDGSYSI